MVCVGMGEAEEGDARVRGACSRIACLSRWIVDRWVGGRGGGMGMGAGAGAGASRCFISMSD